MINDLGTTYWKLYDCREIIRSTMADMCSLNAYEEYRAAFGAVQTALEKVQARIEE